MASVDADGLRDDQWERLQDLVPGGREGQRGPRCDNRLFVDALLWMARSGARWRDLPERFGDYQAVLVISNQPEKLHSIQTRDGARKLPCRKNICKDYSRG